MSNEDEADVGRSGAVAVLGTGAMGSAVARAVLADGRSTTVWNRTPAPLTGPLRTHAALMGDLIESREQAGVDAAPLRQLKAWIDQSVHRGHGEDGFSRLIDEIRPARHRPRDDADTTAERRPHPNN
ncbi:hypothetical protein GCM10028793_54340 [Nocardiopsis oceani]